mgnify:FL=1
MVRRNAIEILAAAFLGAFCSFLGGPSAAARGALLFGILAAGLTVTERLRGWRPIAIGGLFGAAAGVAAALIPEAGGWLERAEMTGVFPLNWGAVIGAAVCGGGWFAVRELDRRCTLSTMESFVLCYLVAIGAFILKSAPDWWFPGAWQGAVAGSAANSLPVAVCWMAAAGIGQRRKKRQIQFVRPACRWEWGVILAALLLAGGAAFSLPVLMENHMFDQPLIRFARTRHDPAVLRGLSGILTCNDVGFQIRDGVVTELPQQSVEVAYRGENRTPYPGGKLVLRGKSVCFRPVDGKERELFRLQRQSPHHAIAATRDGTFVFYTDDVTSELAPFSVLVARRMADGREFLIGRCGFRFRKKALKWREVTIWSHSVPF